jgi:hypothetical protein
MASSVVKSNVGRDAVNYLPFDAVCLLYLLMGMVPFFSADRYLT